MEQNELFKKLIEWNVNEHTEEKDGLTYLSWAWAWQKFLEACPDATYEIKRFENRMTGETTPYLESELGYMVFTSVTAAGITREMWLPVMDGKNKTMQNEPYSYTVRGRDGTTIQQTVHGATMFDVNKAIMRCLTKNLAMFGLGLYIYAGEDLPSEVDEPITEEQKAEFDKLGVNVANTLRYYKVDKVDKLTRKQAEYVIEAKRKAMKNEEGSSDEN